MAMLRSAELHLPDDERRARLHRLDGLLDRLEAVNERDLPRLPDRLVDALRAEDIPCTAATSATSLIKAVWRRQEGLLRPGPPTTRRRPPLLLEPPMRMRTPMVESEPPPLRQRLRRAADSNRSAAAW